MNNTTELTGERRIRIAQRMALVERMLFAKEHTIKEIIDAIEQEFPDEFEIRMKRHHGYDRNAVIENIRHEIQQKCKTLKLSGADAAFMPAPRGRVKFKERDIKPNEIEAWFMKQSNLDSLSWVQRNNIAKALGLA